VEPSELLVEVNESIRELAARSGRADSLEWEFVCECGDDQCDERVSLSLEAYDALRRGGRPALAPPHLDMARSTRARSFRFRDDGMSVTAHGEPRHEPPDDAAATS
jgi:hypothetical protein